VAVDLPPNLAVGDVYLQAVVRGHKLLAGRRFTKGLKIAVR
jgi:hypothetical protein